MIDGDLVRAARGALLEATGTLLRNEDLADRGRLEQFRHLRRRQVRLTKSQVSRKSRSVRLGWFSAPAWFSAADGDNRR